MTVEEFTKTLGHTVTGYLMEGLRPDAFYTALGIVEELQAFPERVYVARDEFAEREARRRLDTAHNTMQHVRWQAVGRGTMAMLLADDEVRSTEARLLLAINMDNVAQALDDVVPLIPVAWRIERDAVNDTIRNLGNAYLTTVTIERPKFPEDDE